MAFNRVILVGNLTADPELKLTPSGNMVTNFSIAVNRKPKQGEQPQVDFFNIVAWKQTAEFISKFFTKGKSILICGQLRNKNWTDNNGVKHYDIEIVADEATFTQNKSEGSSNNSNQKQPQPNYQQQEMPQYGMPSNNNFEDLDDDGELPF